MGKGSKKISIWPPRTNYGDRLATPFDWETQSIVGEEGSSPHRPPHT